MGKGLGGGRHRRVGAMNPDLDPDRSLALAYVPAKLRPSIEALWRLDVALGAVLATGRDPMISRIRLAWWRESLEKLDRQPAPAEPVLQAVAEHLIPLGVSGEELARMEEGWAVLLSPEPLEAEELRAYAHGRGGLLFRLSARLLGDERPFVTSAGERWALVDLARHSGETDSRAAFEEARASGDRPIWPSPLRPLGMLAALAQRDLERPRDEMEQQGSPSRMLRMLRHRLTGR